MKSIPFEKIVSSPSKIIVKKELDFSSSPGLFELYFSNFLLRNAPPLLSDELEIKESEFTFLALLCLPTDTLIRLTKAFPVSWLHHPPQKKSKRSNQRKETIFSSKSFRNEDLIARDLFVFHPSRSSPDNNAIDESMSLELFLKMKIEFSDHCTFLHSFAQKPVQGWNKIYCGGVRRPFTPCITPTWNETADKNELRSVLFHPDSDKAHFRVVEDEDIGDMMLSNILYPQKEKSKVSSFTSWLEVINASLRFPRPAPRIASGNYISNRIKKIDPSGVSVKMIPYIDRSHSYHHSRRDRYSWLNLISEWNSTLKNSPVIFSQQILNRRVSLVKLFDLDQSREINLFLKCGLFEAGVNCSACFAHLKEILEKEVESKRESIQQVKQTIPPSGMFKYHLFFLSS